MRVEVPPKVFHALQVYRQRNGSGALVNVPEVHDAFLNDGLKEEAEWVEFNADLVVRGAVAGFIAEGTVLPPEPPRGSPPEEVW